MKSLSMNGIHEQEERNDQLIREKEEQNEEHEWEPKFEKIEGIDNEQDDVTPQGSTSMPEDLLDHRNANHLVSRSR